MQINASTERALDYIAHRADDVMHAYTAGATPGFGDTATAGTVQDVFDPLCVALPDKTYLLSRDDRGQTLFTRDGSLHLEDGMLRGTDGRPILGFSGTANAAPEPIRIDAVDEALGRARDVRVEADGSIVYDRATIDPRTGLTHLQRICAGRVALARFPAATKLGIVDATHGTAPAGVVPHIGLPGDGNLPALAPGKRNASRIDFDRSLEKLQDAYIAFDAVAAAHKAQAHAGKMVMDLLK